MRWSLPEATRFREAAGNVSAWAKIAVEYAYTSEAATSMPANSGPALQSLLTSKGIAAASGKRLELRTRQRYT